MLKKEVMVEKEEVLFHLDTEQKIPELPPLTSKESVDIKYPLIPPFAYAHIYWDKNTKELMYTVEEPVLDTREKGILVILEDGIKELINLTFISVKEGNTLIQFLEKNIKVLLNELGINVTKESFVKIMYYIYRDFVGLNEIEPLLCDYFIEDIECNGIKFPLYIVHRKYRNLKTNILFNDIPRLARFVEKMAQKAGKYVSYSNPLLDAALPDGSRINATYTTDITSRGPSFSIRKFTKEPWSPTKYIQMNTASPEMLAYLWLLIEHESNIMVIGGTGSGKTSFINNLAFFIPPQARIVSIEDTRELNIEHENWLPSVAREGVGLANIVGQKYGEVSLFDLLKESFRQNPDYVIVGEVRGSIRGNEEIFIIEDGITKRVPIKDLENKDVKRMLIPTLDENKKISLHLIKHFIKHPKRGKLLEIITKTGRKVTITEDHSLFTSEGCKVIPIEGKKLKVGNNVLIPSNMPCGYNDIKRIKTIDYLEELRAFNVQDKVKKAISKIGQKRANKLCGVVARQYCRKAQKSNIPLNLFYKLMKQANIKYNLKDLNVKNGNSKLIPKEIPVNEDFCRFLGYYTAEGHIQNQNREVVITNSNKKIIDDVITLSKKLFKIKPVIKPVVGLGKSNHIIIRSALLVRLLLKLGIGKKDEKRAPSFIYGLSSNKIFAYLRGLYSGDGNDYKNDITFSSKLIKLCEDVMYLLLCLGIVSRLKKEKNKNMYRVSFKRIEDTKRFLDLVGFVNKDYKVLQKGHLHTSSNTVNFKESDFESMKLPRKYRHLKRFMRCSKYYLKNIVDELGANDDIKRFANGEFYLDKIKEINKLNLREPEHVYDLSINPTENFIGGFGGIVLHNSEAFVLFQGMASGHSSFGTMHADDVKTMVRRLETPPINLSPSLVDSMDVVCVMSHVKVKGLPARRVREVQEIVSVKEEMGEAVTNQVFAWNPATDTFSFNRNSYVLKKLSEDVGVSIDKLNNEIRLRTELLVKMTQAKIVDFREVQKIINEYYATPESVLKKFNIK